MALTDQQLMDVRRHAGYPVAGTTMTITDDQDTVYLRYGMLQMSLHKRLTSLSAVEEAQVISYLSTIATLEAAVSSASDNLDTAQASVWVHNANEVSDRMGLLNLWRRRMCEFIGVNPSPTLGNGGFSISRG